MTTNYIETEEEFAENIKYVRKCLELSQQDAAGQLNIERSTYEYYETCKTERDLFHLIKLEDIFYVCLENLIAN